MKNPLPNHAREIVWGSLFGDGGVYYSSGSRNAHFMVCHSHKQREYIEWKHKALFPLVNNGVYLQTHYHKIRKKNYTTLSLRTINHTYFTRLRGYFYPQGKKVVTRRLLNKLTPVGLAVWFMDDGTYCVNNRGYPQLNISTCSYSKQENEIIKRYFKDVWYIDVSVHRRKEHYHLYINKPNSLKLIKIISPYILPCMKYKIQYFHKPTLSN